MDAMTLLDGWDTGAAGSAHARIDRLFRRITPAAELDADTLGMRNQRLLALHRGIGGSPLEAVAPCPHCGAVNEFTLPAHDLLALPVPDGRDRVEVAGQTFRVPRMADLLGGSDLPLAELCRDPAPNQTPITPDVIAQAGALLDALDPVANVVIDLACSGCKALYRASVDIAGFVAAALDRAMARMFRDIDTIARAYGWNEAAIAALPPDRRRRYVTMIEQRGVDSGWSAAR
jgi:hypothetical protein